ncbi:MAG: Ig-like domain-containing protein [Planctomycetota bacterium]
MKTTTRVAAVVLPLLAAACGSGGGGSAGSSSGDGAGATFGTVQLLDYAPADQAVQVPIDASFAFEFDSPMALESFGDEETFLRVTGEDSVIPITFLPGAAGRVACKPNQPLLPETDYTFQLSPLTCDLNGRILDDTVTITFRTFDETPPTIVSFDVPNNATGISRTAEMRLSFSEQLEQDSIDDQSLYLRDVFGGRYPLRASLDGRDVVLKPHADLPGDRGMTLVASTLLTDRAGNRLTDVFQTGFQTTADSDQPSVLASWPTVSSSDVSPLVQPTFSFDESMDPNTVEAASLLFQDEFGSIVPFAIDASVDQRKLRLKPLVALEPDRNYTLMFLLGGAAATDVSGNQLLSTQPLSFKTGRDQDAPQLIRSSPSAGEGRAPGVLVAEIEFDEALDPAWIDESTVQLFVGGRLWESLVELVDGSRVQITPVLTLPIETECELVLSGSQDGVRDLAGNVLATDLRIAFTTSPDASLPDAMVLPPDGAVSIAPASRIAVIFDAPMDASTINPTTIQVTNDSGTALPGALDLSADARIAHFTPTNPLAANTFYNVRVLSGNTGPRRSTGNWFEADRLVRFRTGTSPDLTPPNVSCTINGIPSSRREGLVLPPSGFAIEVSSSDPSGQWVDMGTLECILSGGASGPTPDQLLATARLGTSSAAIIVPATAPLAAGAWTLQVRVRDLSGNLATSNRIDFDVDARTGGALPFERTQVVWVRTDLDRDGNGRSDYQDDLLRLGFATDGDPAGTNDYVSKLLLDGILAKSNRLYKRGDRGEPLDDGSVPLRFTPRQPIALQHMQMALGGLDPEGDRSRTYGMESTGVLGRAYYDYRNGNPTERNTATSPGLGVFPAEMWLYQSEIHEQVYPSFQTVFASRFLPLCPDMGGTAAGSHPLDAAVLTETFDYAAATTQQRARWNTVMAAADDWAAVIGVILAHEVGHSVGLVAPGPMPTGLFGDSSLHDTFAGAAEVMAPSVGYEAMTTLDYQFRDLDLAYLRQRVLLR